MKVRCSLKSAKMRDKDCIVVRRKGSVYVINKKKPKLKVFKYSAVKIKTDTLNSKVTKIFKTTFIEDINFI